MTARGMEFSPFMFLVLALSFFAIAYFIGMMIHSAWMYEDKQNMRRDSKKAWALCMAAGLGVTGWLFYYGYYVNFMR